MTENSLEKLYGITRQISLKESLIVLLGSFATGIMSEISSILLNGFCRDELTINTPLEKTAIKRLQMSQEAVTYLSELSTNDQNWKYYAERRAIMLLLSMGSENYIDFYGNHLLSSDSSKFIHEYPIDMIDFARHVAREYQAPNMNALKSFNASRNVKFSKGSKAADPKQNRTGGNLIGAPPVPQKALFGETTAYINSDQLNIFTSKTGRLILHNWVPSMTTNLSLVYGIRLVEV